MVQTKKKPKKCFRCLAYFTTYKNFDYCQDCAVNNSRYLPRNAKKNMNRIIKPEKKNTKIYDSDKNDADYRKILVEVVSDYGQDLPELEKVSEEIAYEYLFLVVESLIGRKKKKITACCKECRMNAPALREKRTQEIQKLITTYQQF
ncbi:14428_t:CDS:2, partial [Cetraspora pellucida]